MRNVWIFSGQTLKSRDVTGNINIALRMSTIKLKGNHLALQFLSVFLLVKAMFEIAEQYFIFFLSVVHYLHYHTQLLHYPWEWHSEDFIWSYFIFLRCHLVNHIQCVILRQSFTGYLNPIQSKRQISVIGK